MAESKRIGYREIINQGLIAGVVSLSFSAIGIPMADGPLIADINAPSRLS